MKEATIKQYMQNLNQKKSYFKDIDKKIEAIYEANESEEITLQTLQDEEMQRKDILEQQKTSNKQKKTLTKHREFDEDEQE